MSRKYVVYQDTGQWVPFFNWFWRRPNEPEDDAHGAYPTKWLARLAGWWATR